MAIVSMLYGAGGASSAENVSYDNTTSGLEANNVQDAIDEVSADVDSLKVYSETEAAIGTYRGKTLYRKTVVGNTPLTSGVQFPLGIGAVDYLVIESGGLRRSDGGLVPTYYVASNDFAILLPNKDLGIIYCGFAQPNGLTITGIEVTILYTKV